MKKDESAGSGSHDDDHYMQYITTLAEPYIYQLQVPGMGHCPAGWIGGDGKDHTNDVIEQKETRP